MNAINGFEAESRRKLSTSSGFDGNFLSSFLDLTEGLWSFGDSGKYKIREQKAHIIPASIEQVHLYVKIEKSYPF